jgi:hypothetical protein
MALPCDKNVEHDVCACVRDFRDNVADLPNWAHSLTVNLCRLEARLEKMGCPMLAGIFRAVLNTLAEAVSSRRLDWAEDPVLLLLVPSF